ncbi:MAG: alpha/beta hydrolase [Cyanobacteria bacterium P01_H01_bin.15]
MPIDPQAAAFLQDLASSGSKLIHYLPPAEARLATLSSKERRGKPEAVARIRYEFIPGPTADLPILIYEPLESTGGNLLPGLVYFHGGGWVLNNITLLDSVSRAICNQTGCKLVAVNYQKAPEHKFPIPFDDCYASTEWVFEHADDLGIDRNRIGVIGDSAGGNLAAAVALKARDVAGPNIAYQVLIYPALQYGWDTPSAIANATGYFLERDAMKCYWNHYVREPSDGANPYCSPLAATDHSGLPPALVVSAEFDPLCDDGKYYSDKLQQSGVPVKFSFYEGQIHGFLSMAGILNAAQTLFDEIGSEVRLNLNVRKPV